MPKRAREETDSEKIDSVLNIVNYFPASIKLRNANQPLSNLPIKEKTMAAADFELSNAIELFELKYADYLGGSFWDIEEDVGEEEFPTTSCIESLLMNYSKNFDRTSESTCRAAINFMLNECLSVMKGFGEIENAGDGDARPKTPGPLNDIKIYGEVSFTHKVMSRTTTTDPSPNIIVGGRVDHGIGRILKTRFKDAVDQRKRRFYSLLLLVEAKEDRNVDRALAQLIVYLASLRQCRLQRKRTDTSVYGLASDGYRYIFVKISHDGTVMFSRRFDISQFTHDIKKVLGCLKYILELTASRSPESTPEINNGDRGNDEVDESDPPLDLDDNEYMNPPVGEDDGSSTD